MNKAYIKIFAVAVSAAFLAGCAYIICDLNGLYNIKEARVKVFDKDISTCYRKTVLALNRWGAHIYWRSKDEYIVAMHLERVYSSCIDTTELGIFFTEVSPGKTEVRITSLNYNLSSYVSKKLFEYIEKGRDSPAGIAAQHARP